MNTPDMGGHDPVHLELISDTARTVGAVPGCCLVEASIRPFGPDAQYCRFVFDGWSPSLHRCLHDYSFTMSGQYGAQSLDEVRHGMREMAEGVAHVQQWRAQSGRRNGLALPLVRGRADDPDSPPPTIPLRHLSMDRSQLETLTRDLDADRIEARFRDLASKLADLLAEPIGSGDQQRGFNVAVTHRLGRDEHGRTGNHVSDVHEIALNQRHPDHEDVWTEGNTLTIRTKSVPATTLIALPGRPLSDLVDLGPAYDGRIIDRMEDQQNRLFIELAPDYTLLADAFAQWGLDIA